MDEIPRNEPSLSQDQQNPQNPQNTKNQQHVQNQQNPQKQSNPQNQSNPPHNHQHSPNQKNPTSHRQATQHFKTKPLQSKNPLQQQSSMPKTVIRIGHYVLDTTLGSGTFGKVKLAYHQVTNHKVAIKILSRNKIKNLDVVQKIRREIKNLQLVRHPHIIKLYQAISSPTEFYIVMEYVSGGELFEYIVNKSRLSERETRKLFQQLISGVDYCHRHGVVHRDLKPENLLLDENKNIRIVDFGLSNITKDGQFLKTSCGSPNYAAPEVIEGRLYAGPEIDIWSCGVILYAMIAGHLPFDDDNINQLFKKIRAGHFHIPDFISPGLRNLLKGILNTSQVHRYNIAQIKEDAWFKIDLPGYLFPADIIANRDIVDMEIVYEVCKKFDMGEKEVLKVIEKRNNETNEIEEMRKKLGEINLVDEISELEKSLKNEEFVDSVFVAYRMMLDAKIFEQTAPGFYRASEFKNPTEMNLLRRLDKNHQNSHSPAAAHMEHIPKPNVETDTGELVNPGSRQSRNFFKWHLGIRSKAHPAEIMIEVYRALKRLGFQWKIITYYLIDVRRKVPGSNRNCYMTIQLYQLDCRTFFVDFANKVPEGDERANLKMDIGFTVPLKIIDPNEGDNGKINTDENSKTVEKSEKCEKVEKTENLAKNQSKTEESELGNDSSEDNAAQSVNSHSEPGIDNSSSYSTESQTVIASSTSSLKKEFDKLQASFTSLPESEMSEITHETQGRIILKNGKKVRPKEHVVMEFFEMCSDLIQALTCPR